MNITAKHYAQALYESLDSADSHDRTTISQKFLRLLYEHGQLKQLPHILQQVSELEQSASGVVNVVVTTASAMPEAEIQSVVQKLVDSDSPQIQHHVDEDLIGGITVETKDKRWDLSARGQLRALQHTLRG